jgi:type III restriction enzyme
MGSELGRRRIEVKGFQTEPDRAKEVAAQRWVKAVNHHGGFGLWDLAVCREPHKVLQLIQELAALPPGPS